RLPLQGSRAGLSRYPLRDRREGHPRQAPGAPRLPGQPRDSYRLIDRVPYFRGSDDAPEGRPGRSGAHQLSGRDRTAQTGGRKREHGTHREGLRAPARDVHLRSGRSPSTGRSGWLRAWFSTILRLLPLVPPMNKILVFTATYNEIDNIASLLDAIFAALPACDVLVVDDNSPDKTGDLLDQLQRREPRLQVIHRPRKNGLGTAHKLAVKYALAEKYDALITMDADFSHDPSYLPVMVRELEQAEFVIGSRYVAGGSCEYPLSRVVLSRVANSLARTVLGIPVHETTTSYRGFRRSLLQRMNIDAIRSEGYSY